MPALCCVFPAALPALDPETNLKPDEEILFVPGIGYRDAKAQEWLLQIQGCVYEPGTRGIMLAVLRKALELKDVDLTPDQNALLTQRARLFTADRQRGKRVVVRLGNRTLGLPKTEADGWFQTTARLSDEEVRGLVSGEPDGTGRVVYEAILPRGDPRRFAGKVLLVPERGLFVVSDIDDTIKATDVLDTKAMLRNTFLEPFRAVSGMDALFRRLAESSGCHFAYVSASPWQLFTPLSAFVQSSQFPEGTFHLRQLRWTGKSLLGLFQGPEKHKLATLEPLLRAFPQRQFILVGDSGERDPEIYANLARRYPDQVRAILIREVRLYPDCARFKQAFAALPASKWKLFADPAELPQFLGDAELLR